MIFPPKPGTKVISKNDSSYLMIRDDIENDFKHALFIRQNKRKNWLVNLFWLPFDALVIWRQNRQFAKIYAKHVWDALNTIESQKSFNVLRKQVYGYSAGWRNRTTRWENSANYDEHFDPEHPPIAP